MKDLEKNNKTGLLRLTDRHRLTLEKTIKRSQAFEKAIISYFRSRNEDYLKKPIPAINKLITNSKSRISSYDVVRPSNTLPGHFRTSWTTDINQTYNSDNEYVQLQDTRSGYPANETSSFSIGFPNDSYYPTSSRGSYPQRYHNNDFCGQFIYYDDENGNNHALAPGEISF